VPYPELELLVGQVTFSHDKFSTGRDTVMILQVTAGMRIYSILKDMSNFILPFFRGKCNAIQIHNFL